MSVDSETEKKTPPRQEGAYLVGIREVPEESGEAREHLAELKELVATLGVPVVGDMTVTLREFHPRFFVGTGKAEEIRAAALETHAELIVFDSSLGPSQQRNLERLCGIKVIDRQEVILDIFAERAWTREAVLQVELARCRYFLPRLRRKRPRSRCPRGCAR